MKKILFLFPFSFLLSLAICDAVADDKGAGIELSASKKVTKGLSISLDGEVRTQEAVSEMERFSIGADLSYKISSWLKADAGYLLMAKRTLEKAKKNYVYSAYWSPRHRAFSSLTFSWEPIKHFEISLRERYQWTQTPGVNVKRYYVRYPGVRAADKWAPTADEHLLRSRIEVQYSRKKLAWEPYVSIESLNDLSDGFANDQMRYTLGTDYRINKHNKVGLSYRYKDKSNSEEDKGHLVTVSYNHAF